MPSWIEFKELKFLHLLWSSKKEKLSFEWDQQQSVLGIQLSYRCYITERYSWMRRTHQRICTVECHQHKNGVSECFDSATLSEVVYNEQSKEQEQRLEGRQKRVELGLAWLHWWRHIGFFLLYFLSVLYERSFRLWSSFQIVNTPEDFPSITATWMCTYPYDSFIIN